MSIRTRILWTAAVLSTLVAVPLLVGHELNNRLIAATARRVDAGRNWTPEQHLVRDIAFAHEQLRDPTYEQLQPRWVRLYYRWNPLHPGAADVLRWGSDYRGPCGSHANVAIALLLADGVPARPLLIRDDREKVIHTVVEAHIGGRWVVADAAYGIVYRLRDGRLATAREIAADTALFLAHTRGVPGYGRDYDYDSVALMNWHKVPALFPMLKAGLDATIGPARANLIAKPLIWLRPRAAFGSLFAGIGGLFLVLALLSSRFDPR